MVTAQDALNQALTLYYQNAKYEDIAQHLKKIGYISARTHKPLKAQAVRLMILDHISKTNRPPRDRPQGTPAEVRKALMAEEEDTAPVRVGGEKADLLQAIKVVAELDISADLKLNVMQALLVKRDQER